MLEAGERMAGPYRWDRYDVLIMPRAFAYGGMENPRLSFISPSIIAGDRSLVSGDRARARAFLVRQPRHQRDLERLLAQRGIHELPRAPARRGALRQASRRHGGRDRLRGARADDRGPRRPRARRRTRRSSSTSPAATRTKARPTSPTKGRWFLGFLEERFGQARVRRVPARVFRCARVPEHDDRRLPHRAAGATEASRARRRSRPRRSTTGFTARACRRRCRRCRRASSMPVDRAAADWRAGSIATDATAGEGLGAAGVGAIPRRAARGPRRTRSSRNCVRPTSWAPTATPRSRSAGCELVIRTGYEPAYPDVERFC